MLTLVCLLLFPAIVGLIVSYVMEKDRQEDKLKERLKKDSQGVVRFFRLKKTTNILCFKHLNHLKRKQVALIDASRCRVCLDNKRST